MSVYGARGMRPVALTSIPDAMPQDLKRADQWVGWRWEKRNGKWTKPPLNPATGGYARNNDPSTWASFESALSFMRKRKLPGIGFMFHPDDGLAGVDLDDCRKPDAGEIEPWALKIIRQLDSYAEISPTATGVKIIVCGTLPLFGRRKGKIEMYDRGRFFTLTGHRLPGAPAEVKARQDALDSLHRDIFGEEEEARGPAAAAAGFVASNSLDDRELLDRAMGAANAGRFAPLWAGDISGYQSLSEADLALISMLSFWCGPDEERIDRLFRRSALMRKKWDEVHFATGETYGERTIRKALSGKGDFWRGREKRRGRVYARREAVIRRG
ncbi:MAG: hypothetical protein IRY88_14000 [Rubrobacteraceae bacterium]|nr:hypothetical protein [Rubrobacteraceae bacterium]